jgi:hypothetical protein
MWLVLTVAATLIVWAAVSVVAADVTDRPAPVVGHRDVVVALQAGATKPATTTTVTAAPPVTAPRAPATTATGRSPTANQGRATTTTTPVAAPGPGPTTTLKPPARPPAATTTTTVAPAGGTATYSTAGGVVEVACTGFSGIRLVAALPFDGFQALVLSGGPFFVQVNFIGQGRNIAVGAACVFGQPFQYTQGQNPGAGPPTTNLSGG